MTVATTHDNSSGALFLAAARGYFKNEGIDLAMRACPNAQVVAEVFGMDATDFGLAAFSATVFQLAARGEIKAIATQARE